MIELPEPPWGIATTPGAVWTAGGEHGAIEPGEQAEPGQLPGQALPLLPGLVTEGDTLEEARVMARDAIGLYLPSLQKAGLPLP